MHSHLGDESLVPYSPFDYPRTKHRKNQERCAEVLIAEHLKKYIDEYNNFIIPLDEQIVVCLSSPFRFPDSKEW